MLSAGAFGAVSRTDLSLGGFRRNFHHELRTLDLSNCPNLSDLSALKGLTGLRRLNLSGCSMIEDISPLAEITGLDFLDISGCLGVKTLAPIRQLVAADVEIRMWE